MCIKKQTTDLDAECEDGDEHFEDEHDEHAESVHVTQHEHDGTAGWLIDNFKMLYINFSQNSYSNYLYCNFY